jgi:hypothetical protein
MITLVTKTRATRRSPTRRRMIASAITSKRRVIRPCTTTTPLCQAQTLCPEIGVAPVPGLLLALAPVLVLAQAAATGATPTIMLLIMTTSQVDPSSANTCTLRTKTMDITIVPTRAILFSPPVLLQKQRGTSILTNRESRQQSKIFVFHLVSLFQIGN